MLFPVDICVFSSDLRSAVLRHPEAHGQDVLRVAQTDNVFDPVPHADTVQGAGDHSGGLARLLHDRGDRELHADYGPLDLWLGRGDLRPADIWGGARSIQHLPETLFENVEVNPFSRTRYSYVQIFCELLQSARTAPANC